MRMMFCAYQVNFTILVVAFDRLLLERLGHLVTEDVRHCGDDPPVATMVDGDGFPQAHTLSQTNKAQYSQEHTCAHKLTTYNYMHVCVSTHNMNNRVRLTSAYSIVS